MKNKEEFEKSVYQKCAAYKRRRHRNIALCSVLSLAVFISASAAFISMKATDNDSTTQSLCTTAIDAAPNYNGATVCDEAASSVFFSGDSEWCEYACGTVTEEFIQEEPVFPAEEPEATQENEPTEETSMVSFLRIYSYQDFDEYEVSDEQKNEIITFLDENGFTEYAADKAHIEIIDSESVISYYIDPNLISQFVSLLDDDKS